MALRREEALGLRPRDGRHRLQPSRLRSRVTRIGSSETELPFAVAGQSVMVSLADERDISRGDTLVRADQPAPAQRQQVAATLCWLSTTPLSTARSYVLQHTTRSDLLGNHNVSVGFGIYGSLKDSDLYLSYLNRSRRTNYALSAFQFRKRYGLLGSNSSVDVEHQTYRGLQVTAIRPFDKFSRLEASLQLAGVAGVFLSVPAVAVGWAAWKQYETGAARAEPRPGTDGTEI